MEHLLPNTYILLIHLRASHDDVSFEGAVHKRNISIDGRILKVCSCSINQVDTSLLEEVHISTDLLRYLIITTNAKYNIASIEVILDCFANSLEFFPWVKVRVRRIVDSLKDVINKLKVGQTLRNALNVVQSLVNKSMTAWIEVILNTD